MPSADPPSSSSRPSKPISIAFGASKPKGPPLPPAKKRPHSALADNSDGEDEGQPAPQLLSGFDHSGAVVSNGRKEERALLVIQAEKNRDWREESRKKRRKNLLPAEVQAARSGSYVQVNAAHVDRDEISKQSGISFVQKDEDGDASMAEGPTSLQAPETIQAAHVVKTAEEEAMEALLGGEKKKSTLVLPVPADDGRNGHDPDDPAAYEDYANEDDRFRADVASRPDVSTLDEYDAVPVDGFGAALMRGMGWKDGDPVGKRRTLTTTNTTAASSSKKPRIVERRPAFLGIGAKEVPTGVGDDELGAWGKGAKGSKRKTDLTYHPVILKNSVTGEMLTEEELAEKKKKQQQQVENTNGGATKGNKGQEEDWRERRDRNLAADGRRKMEEGRKKVLLIKDEEDEGTRREERRRSGSKERNHHHHQHHYYHHGSSPSSSSSSSSRRDRSPHRSSSRRDRSPPSSSSFDERDRERERRYRRY